MVKVKNMRSNNGNKIANQFIITDNDKEIFQSYDSVIAIKVRSCESNKLFIFLDEYYWDYSRTTGKYRNQFLGEGITETRKKIETGEYILKDLNSKGGDNEI
jgi:hypothetical protein